MPRLPLFKHPILHFKNKRLHHKCKYAESSEGTVIEEINGVKIVFDFSKGKMIKSMYFGCHEFEIRRLINKYLKPGDIFIDVGANIGYFSAIGAGLVGKTGQVHCFEPIPTYFSYINKMIELNPEYTIKANNIALGEKTGQCRISCHRRNAGGNSIIPGFIFEEDISETIDVEINRLDNYIEKEQLKEIALIKIDTEGYELPVLLGLSRFFDEHKNHLPSIIAEITPKAFELMDKKINDLYDFMSSYGYKSYAICGKHYIDIRKIKSQTDVLFKT